MLMANRMIKPIPALFVILIVVLGIAAAKPFVSVTAHAEDVILTNYPTYVLVYRNQNRWVDQREKESLDNLTRYAKRNKINSFSIVLPENADNNLYIERLLVLSHIMKSRLRNDTIVFRQELGKTPANTISVTPSTQKSVVE